MVKIIRPFPAFVTSSFNVVGQVTPSPSHSFSYTFSAPHITTSTSRLSLTPFPSPLEASSFLVSRNSFKSNMIHKIQSMATVTMCEPPQAELTPGEGEVTELSRLEIRVGKIVQVDKHPDADSLYVEKIDIGEVEPRTIVSGLVKFVPQDQLLNRTVVVLCNLKPRAMRGITSHGMLLCASNPDHTEVDPLAPPAGVPVGELVKFMGHKSEPVEPGNRAGKAFDKVAPDLNTSEDGTAFYQGLPFMTSKGPCFSPAKLKGSIS